MITVTIRFHAAVKSPYAVSISDPVYRSSEQYFHTEDAARNYVQDLIFRHGGWQIDIPDVIATPEQIATYNAYWPDAVDN